MSDVQGLIDKLTRPQREQLLRATASGSMRCRNWPVRNSLIDRKLISSRHTLDATLTDLGQAVVAELRR